MTTQLPTISISSTALLYMDFQVDICAHYPHAEALIARAGEVLEKVRSKGVVVGHVRVAFEESDYQAIPERNKAFSTLGAIKRFPAAAPDSQIVAELAPVDGEISVRKTRVGAMSTTNLEEQLQGKGIDTLVLAGIATSGVVLSTVRAGADKDFRILVLSDLCLDADPQVHQVLIEKVFPRQAWVMSSEDFLTLI